MKQARKIVAKRLVNKHNHTANAVSPPRAARFSSRKLGGSILLGELGTNILEKYEAHSSQYVTKFINLNPAGANVFSKAGLKARFGVSSAAEIPVSRLTEFLDELEGMANEIYRLWRFTSSLEHSVLGRWHLRRGVRPSLIAPSVAAELEKIDILGRSPMAFKNVIRSESIAAAKALRRRRISKLDRTH